MTRVTAPALQTHAPRPACPTQPAAGAPAVRSQQLLGHGSELRILHGNEVYRLRITSLGKLILTK